jgi:putative transcriptional regulator
LRKHVNQRAQEKLKACVSVLSPAILRAVNFSDRSKSVLNFSKYVPFAGEIVNLRISLNVYMILRLRLLVERRRMSREETLNTAEHVLKSAGFKISKRCISRPSCFCMAARRSEDLAIINVPSDLGKISLKDALQMQAISSLFSATPLFVGNMARDRTLEDDTVYSRYDVYAVTLKTLDDFVNRRMMPLVEAGPGGYYVRLNGDSIRQRRMKLGLSVGKLAEQLRISRRTLYGYERGMVKASVSAAYNLEWILGMPVVKPIDIFKPAPPDAGFFAMAKRIIVKNRFLKNVMKKLILCDFKVAATTRAPFDFVAQPPNKDVKIIGGVTCRGERSINERAEEILSISEVVEAQPLFVTDGNVVPEIDIPLIVSDELDHFHLAEDWVSRL